MNRYIKSDGYLIVAEFNEVTLMFELSTHINELPAHKIEAFDTVTELECRMTELAPLSAWQGVTK